ncbi:MAG: hypothetical protein U1E62_14910 [Alsobacter sp.]
MIDQRDLLAGAKTLASVPDCPEAGGLPAGGRTSDWLDGVRTAHHLGFAIHNLRHMQALLARAERRGNGRERAALWDRLALMVASLQGSLRVVSAKALHESRKAGGAP